MKIYSPVKDYTGVTAGVGFSNGVGETDSPHLIGWFKENGYKVEEDSELIYTPQTHASQISGQSINLANEIQEDKIDSVNLTPDPNSNPIPLEKLKIEDLKGIASEKGIALDGASKKDEIIEKLKEHVEG